ncbi:50S ribosomal protein L23 [Candidatus Gottesmanbacteria bacterium]|nr:50S ribosomal protein L23 [Candidatus Gottesmanbacteria bacterium]
MKNNTSIIRALLTEKTMQEAKEGKYTFQVVLKSGKREIKKDVESQFGVNVQAVKTITIQGKSRSVGSKRTKVAKSPWKKAVLTLKPEQKIDLFEVSS